MLNIGITTRCFSGLPILEAAKIMQSNGFKCTELYFTHPELDGWKYNEIGSLEGITAAKVKEAADIFRSHGIEVTALGLFTDLRNPDEAVRAKTFDYCRSYMEFASAAGIRYIGTECGFTKGRRGVNADTYRSDYLTLKESLREICLEAEKYNVNIALNGTVLDIIPSPRRLKTLIEELEEDSRVRLKSLLDPADFIANSDEEGLFCYLKHDIGYFHGKDGELSSCSGCNMGDGDVDWEKFMECYIRFADKTPFILNCCDRENCGVLKKRAEDYYDAAIQRILNRIY